MKGVKTLQDCMMLFLGSLAIVLALATLGKSFGGFSPDSDDR